MVHPFGTPLSSVGLRVLGVLIEKEITTPDQYPLSLVALVNGCNQRSSREPVMNLSEADVSDALATLEEHALIAPLRDARVTKYEHRSRFVLNLRRDEIAVLCLLLLRGPQTAGELRSRAERLYRFDDLASIQSTLDRLSSRKVVDGGDHVRPRDLPLILQMPRQPGSREARYVHLLGDATTSPCSSELHGVEKGSHPDAGDVQREINLLRAQVAALEDRIERLERA